MEAGKMLSQHFNMLRGGPGRCIELSLRLGHASIPDMHKGLFDIPFSSCSTWILVYLQLGIHLREVLEERLE
jgi:hypothetical protein